MSQPVNSALSAIPAAERRFGFLDHLTLWGSLGVGLLVIQLGTFLVPALRNWEPERKVLQRRADPITNSVGDINRINARYRVRSNSAVLDA